MCFEKVVKVIIKHHFFVSNFFNIFNLPYVLLCEPDDEASIHDQIDYGNDNSQQSECLCFVDVG